MPMLADLDSPEPRRTPGFLVGLVIAVPVALVLGWVTMPRLVGAIMGGAAAHDERARGAAEYMGTLCSAPDPTRDGELCGCALGAEFPGMDCMDHFAAWSVERHVEQCADEATQDAALSFCACEEQVFDEMNESPSERRGIAGKAHPRCRGLEDAIDLPPATDLAR
jgi:hypothetical protein